MNAKVEAFRAALGQGAPLVCLTSYTAPMTKILDPHVDLLLVGDSVGMALYGMETTLEVDLEMMIRHGRAVAKTAERAVVVVDLPAGTYEEGPDQARATAMRVFEATGAHAVKLEGGLDMAPSVAATTDAGVAVMGHIGLQPQQVVAEGGYKIKGKTDEDVDRLIADGLAIEAARAFSIVIEGTVEAAAKAISDKLTIPPLASGPAPPVTARSW